MKTRGTLEVKIPSYAPDCLCCRHYEVTWEPAFPRGCRLFAIKCRNLPSMEVFISTGKHCFAFEAREEVKPLPGSEGGLWV